ncbi:hypothetical protein Athai_32090 [Actinocatenispora thailandica]|uniref:Ferric siderophore reductase C-terminal domain-containing protein n=1 Tax=Actinocatenispora thailandica TaxID=227318 RepID=A0A7R7HXG2_9ACTN|nr:(2Fe-2S)-binding protein [Actinocatenispora thailandica]BCJ35706.1 hypothetical protein Athai_32090 [Actinocatenispora thailandica]
MADGGVGSAAAEPGGPADPVAMLAGLGPFFAVQAFDPATPPGPPWRPMRELTDDPAVLTDRVERVRAGLAMAAGVAPTAVEERVAASVTQLGLMARVLSPALAVAVETGTVLPWSLRNLYWQPALGGPFPFAVPNPAPGRPWHTDAVAGDFRRAVLDTVAGDLVGAAGRWPLSVRIRWGNVASALGGAAGMLSAGAPERRDRTLALLSALLRTQPLRGTATVDRAGRLRRRSCCLIYRTAGRARPGNLCGDCVLAIRH